MPRSRKSKLVVSILAATAVVVAVALGLVALMTTSATPADAAPCICPKIWAPVTCSNGKTYPNQCVANCHHAKNCVPSGDGV